MSAASDLSQVPVDSVGDFSERSSTVDSFTVTAIGNLAKNPELGVKGEMMYTRFCLVGNDYAGKDEEGAAKEMVTSLWFVAFGVLGDAIAKNARKGDQMIVDARIRANNWTDRQGEKQYDYSFVVRGFRFGAPGKITREAFKARREAEEEAELEYPVSVLHGPAHSDMHS